MLTSIYNQAQNIPAVENGRYGLGGLFDIGALRHLSGGIFVRACITFMSERCGTSTDVPPSGIAVRQPAAPRSPSWRVVSRLLNTYRSLVMQENASIGTSVPVLSIVKNQVTALSTDVAQFFGKLHTHVLRDIENLLNKLPPARQTNFGLCFENSELQNSKPLKRYRMTRDGFTLLVMGWTGEKALQFKLAWLDAFNAMEEELRARNTVQLLPPSSPLGRSVAPAIAASPLAESELLRIQSVMKAKFQEKRDLLRAFSILQHHFCVTSYRQIPRARFEEVLNFAKNLVLTPKKKVTKPSLPVLCYDSPNSFLLTFERGEPRIKKLGDNWSLVKSTPEWAKAYCKFDLPPNEAPELIQILLKRMTNH